MLFSLAGNYLANQNPDINQAAKILADESKIEFIVASDLYLTPSAKFADLLLPETSFMERWNIGETWGTGNYVILSEKLVEPEFERRSDYEWLREVAAKLNVEPAFSEGRDEKQWIEHIVETTRAAMPDENMPDFAQLQVQRRHLFKSEPYVAFADNIRDPENHPFATPSGKIEIFSKRLYDSITRRSRHCRITHRLMKALRMRSPKNTRYSSSPGKGKTAPTLPSTLTRGCRKPRPRNCGLIRWMRPRAVSNRAIKYASTTTAVSAWCQRK